MEEEEIGENYNIKLTFNNQDINISIDSKYDSFIQKICNILQISLEEINSFGLSYTDEDGDNILITTEDDYNIFIQQVKEKLVNNLIIEKNNNKKNDVNLNQIKENINNENHLQYLNKNINNSKNNINVSNTDINNNNISYNKSNNFENNESNKIIHDKGKEDVPIENIVYYYRCSSCSTYPIVCVMYYCDKCNLYLCENCEKNNDNHEHGLIKIKNIDQLVKIKDEENEKIAQKNKEEEQLNNNNYKHYLNNNNLHHHNDNNNFSNSHNNNNYLNNNNNMHTNQNPPFQSYDTINQSCGNNQNNNYNYYNYYNYQRNNNNSHYNNTGSNLSSFNNNYFHNQNNNNEFGPFNHLYNIHYNNYQYRINYPQLNFDYSSNIPMGNNLRYDCRPLMNEIGQTYRIYLIGRRYYI